MNTFKSKKEVLKSIKNDFANIVKETNIFDIIMDYKKEMEHGGIIEKYNDDWNEIVRDSSLSCEFIIRFKNRLNWSYILEYHYISDKMKKECKEEIIKGNRGLNDSMKPLLLKSAETIRKSYDEYY